MSDKGANGVSRANGAAQPPEPPDEDYIEDYWRKCKLTTILTDPPRHELALPGGQVIRLRTRQFFDPGPFTIAFVDATGSFPPLPKQKPGPFLIEQFQRWLTERATVTTAAEASERGTLLADIEQAIQSCPESEDPRDMDRGAIYLREGGKEVWVSARILLERVRRACPVKFTPGDFYAAMIAVGCKNLDVQREKGWRGRAWQVPMTLRAEPPQLPEAPPVGPALDENDAAEPPPELPFG